jgi:hypothetical protein
VRRETAQRVKGESPQQWCAGRPRKEQKVKVLNSQGIASHAGPESCAAHREVRDEALTGEPAGQSLSHEIGTSVQGADAVTVAEGNTDGRDNASAWPALRVISLIESSFAGAGAQKGSSLAYKITRISLVPLFALMWSRADVIGLFSINLVSFSRNVVLSGPSFSINVV